MKSEIFREYDIRGIYPSDLNEDISYTFGQSFANYISENIVIVGHDNRLSSKALHESLLNGLTQSGCDVIDLGLCTTPMYYAIKKHLQIKNGIMITASHNPKEYNGFKISFDLVGNACGKEIYDFRDFTFQKNFPKSGNGKITKYEDTQKVYFQMIKNGINLGAKKIKVVVDPGNGTSCPFIKDIFGMFDIETVFINDVSDGNFPAHHPDPCEEKNMVMLADMVKKLHYDLGIGIDGDADRVGIVDDKGTLIAMDKLMTVMYKYMYPTLKNKKAITDCKCSRAMIEELEKINLPLEIYRTGNSYMNRKINGENIDFGGEFSGHIWFTDRWNGFDDGIYAGLRFIEMLSNLDESLSQMIEKLPKYLNTPEIKITVKEEEKDFILNKVKEYLDNKNIKYNTVDGIRVDYDDGFALIRKSNTGPNLTLRFEKKDQKSLDEITNEFLDLVKNYLN